MCVFYFSDFNNATLISDVTKLKEILNEGITFFSTTVEFRTEAAQLSRLIFMNCKQFRMMRGLQDMKKVNQALLRYLNMDFVTTLETLNGFISDGFESEITVPYRQNLDYVLIKLQGLSKLLVRIVICIKASASFFLGLIKAGSFYMKGSVFISTLASIWNMSREMCKFAVRQYNKLISFRMKLEEKPGLQWISPSYQFPEYLEDWIGDEWTQLIVNETYAFKILAKKEDVKTFLSNREEFTGILDRMKDDGHESDVIVNEPAVEIIQVNDDELDSFEPLSRTIVKKETEKFEYIHQLASLTTKNSIEKFLKTETSYRKVDTKKSLTISKMKQKVWKEFKKDITNKSILMQEGALINYIKDYLEEYKIE